MKDLNKHTKDELIALVGQLTQEKEQAQNELAAQATQNQELTQERDAAVQLAQQAKEEALNAIEKAKAGPDEKLLDKQEVINVNKVGYKLLAKNLKLSKPIFQTDEDGNQKEMIFRKGTVLDYALVKKNRKSWDELIRLGFLKPITQ